MFGFNDWINENKNNEKKFVQSVMDKYGKSMPPIDANRYTPIKGLEGPFRSKSGRIVYYDPKEGKYYDRDSDIYLSDDVMEQMSIPQQTGAPQVQRNVTQSRAIQGIRDTKSSVGTAGLTELSTIMQAIQQLATTDKNKAGQLINRITQAVNEIAPELSALIRSKKTAFLGSAAKSGQQKPTADLSKIGKY